MPVTFLSHAKQRKAAESTAPTKARVRETLPHHLIFITIRTLPRHRSAQRRLRETQAGDEDEEEEEEESFPAPLA
jgi:hypothetical protein